MPELLEPSSRRPVSLLGLPFQRLALLAAAVIGLGIYIGVLLFGDNSLTRLLVLEEQEHQLKTEIKRLKEQNAKLQKEYFELKQLDPES